MENINMYFEEGGDAGSYFWSFRQGGGGGYFQGFLILFKVHKWIM